MIFIIHNLFNLSQEKAFVEAFSGAGEFAGMKTNLFGDFDGFYNIVNGLMMKQRANVGRSNYISGTAARQAYNRRSGCQCFNANNAEIFLGRIDETARGGDSFFLFSVASVTKTIGAEFNSWAGDFD